MLFELFGKMIGIGEAQNKGNFATGFGRHLFQEIAGGLEPLLLAILQRRHSGAAAEIETEGVITHSQGRGDMLPIHFVM